MEAIYELPKPFRFHFSEYADKQRARALGDFLPAGAWIKALKAAPNDDAHFFAEVRLADGTVLGRGWVRRETLVREAAP